MAGGWALKNFRHLVEGKIEGFEVEHGSGQVQIADGAMAKIKILGEDVHVEFRKRGCEIVVIRIDCRICLVQSDGEQRLVIHSRFVVKEEVIRRSEVPIQGSLL